MTLVTGKAMPIPRRGVHCVKLKIVAKISFTE